MGEPWLDSLSEDWNSEPRLSSPASSLANSKHGTRASRTAQSRIPHLAHSMRKESSGGSFLRPRSSRGIAKSKDAHVLSERSASDMNLRSSTTYERPSKRLPSSTVPRKPSSNLSSSQQSVQHHTIDTATGETPEWKKRLQNGEAATSDGFDLFSPSKLEGMFAQPPQPMSDRENRPSSAGTDAKPWISLKHANMSAAEPFHSLRGSRSRAPVMASLPEMNEEEGEEELEHSMSAISSELVRKGTMQGLVRKRVDNLEHTRNPHSPGEGAGHPVAETALYAPGDPRWRTLSGQQEIRNEDLTPVTISTKNTISANAVRASVDLDPVVLKQKLMEASTDPLNRPSSRSSDRQVSYNGQGAQEELSVLDELLADTTSHSLPEDLSMGTQDFVSHGGYVNRRRGAGSNETSFLKKKLSSVNEATRSREHSVNVSRFRSSPPPYHTANNASIDSHDNSDEFPVSEDESVVHHDTSPQRPTSAGSPLKLFGNRDTYTNNKLLRVLSQYEEEKDDTSSEKPSTLEEEAHPPSGSGLRMSQFGRGELDTFHFEKEVQRPLPATVSDEIEGEKIFQSLADLTIEDEGTIPFTRAGEHASAPDRDDPNAKRSPSSPSKDKERTPKRRRTLLRDEIAIDGIGIQIKVDHVQSGSSLAGQKRKDARSGEDGTQADPTTLASRSILKPKPGSRKSSGEEQSRSSSQDSTIKRKDAPNELTEALAVELASFAQGVSLAHQDSRKPSLATKDYMEEANKVMEFIRARGKPKPPMPNIREPIDVSDIDADRILDLEVEDESTVEPFSRPPSREGPVRQRDDRRVAKHDPQIASHLQKFKESDDLEMVASTSATGTLHLADNGASTRPAVFPAGMEGQESSSSNIRIRESKSTHMKRKHSASPKENQVNTAQSSDCSTRRTFVTESSNSSGHKGMITSGKISIPDTVGTMTFDHEKQVWIKRKLAEIQEQNDRNARRSVNKYDEATLDGDPFEDIPDLSIDEQREAAMRVVPKSSSRPSSATTVLKVDSTSSEDGPQQKLVPENHQSILPVPSNVSPDGQEEMDETKDGVNDSYTSQEFGSLRSEASKHEERLHQGLPSKEPNMVSTTKMQPRVVTIAFSSPVASEIPVPTVDMSAPASDDEEFLPPDDSDDDAEYLKTPRMTKVQKETDPMSVVRVPSANSGFQRSRSVQFERRPVSRIEELDENAVQGEGMSLVCLKDQDLSTPGPAAENVASKTASAYRGTSILCLTPLSEFTMHQADKVNHPEESFVQQRAHPKALLQAHGALSLSVDTLIKAITDAVPNEPFWEQMRSLDLKDSRLQSVHGLQDYCPGLERLDVSHNEVAQLDGLPRSLRQLYISHNKVNDFSCWGHLQNLQYVDVSANRLENLEGFSSLIHMRRLKCSSNNIRDIEGVVDLDGLMSLDLCGNQLTELNFEGVDMPRLEELDLSNNKLTAVQNLDCLPQLRFLDLSSNSLREICVRQPLKHLRTLVVSHNELETLDLTMFPALTELDVDGNCIRLLDGLSNTSRLRKLAIRDQRSPASIVDLVLATPNECSEIFLSTNVLSQGQMQLPKFPQYNLQHLEIAGCGLRCLPPGFGDYFPNCRYLNLNFNAVSDLSPLLGCIKLQSLLLAGNRIKRLRRTCLAMSRMPALETVDIRDNPLTVGFYAPEQTVHDDGEIHALPKRSASRDSRWLQLLDETTALRRRMIELLLVEGCPKLQELDGSSFNHEQVREHDVVVTNLAAKGVLVRAIEAPPPQQPSPSSVGTPTRQSLRE